MIANDFASFSPDRRYAVRFFDCTQISPHQSDRLIFRYKFEIVREKYLGESGIRFENGYLDYFPAVFDGFDAEPLWEYRAYVMLEKNEWKRRNCADYLEKYLYWSPDSRFLTIFVISANQFDPNKIITFDVKTRQYRSVDFKGIPDEKQLHYAGNQLTAVLKQKDAAIGQLIASLLMDRVPETKPKSRLVRVDEYDAKKPLKESKTDTDRQVERNNATRNKLDFTALPDYSPEKKLKRLFWSIYIPGIMAAFGFGSYVITGTHPIDPYIRWGIIGAVTVIGTLYAIFIRIHQHKKINERLRRYLAIGNVVGKDYSIFEKALGLPSSKIPAYIVDQKNRQGYIANWAGYNYQISILFYSDNHKCVSIKHEVLPVLGI